MLSNVQINKKTWTVHLPSPKAALPVIKKSCEIEWVTWGKRKEEDVSYFPNGGWARLDSIKEGKWERYHPKVAFMVSIENEKIISPVSLSINRSQIDAAG